MSPKLSLSLHSLVIPPGHSESHIYAQTLCHHREVWDRLEKHLHPNITLPPPHPSLLEEGA